MLILPPGHAAQRSRPMRPLAARERRMIAVIGVVAAALLAVTVIAFATGSHKSANGCVDLKLPYSTGGAEIYACGARARATCANLTGGGGVTGPTRNAVIAECRKAGLPAG